MSRYDINKLFPNYPNDVIKTYESFMTPELQNSLLDLASVASDFSKAISFDLLNQFADLSKQFSSDYAPVISAVFKELSDNMASITPELISFISNIENGVSDLSDIVNSSATAFSSLADYHTSDDSDYVILNETPIRELNVPEKITIAVGHNRVRMSTSIFITLITFVIASFIGIASFIADRIEFNSNAEDTAQLLEYEREQTFYLREIFNSLDTSNSSQKEFLEDTRSVFRSQNEAQDTSPVSSDNSHE